MKPNPKYKKCRHAKTWLLSDGFLEWCYQCGAFRKMTKYPGGVTPNSLWCRPVGVDGENPFDDWHLKSQLYSRRKYQKSLKKQ